MDAELLALDSEIDVPEEESLGLPDEAEHLKRIIEETNASMILTEGDSTDPIETESGTFLASDEDISAQKEDFIIPATPEGDSEHARAVAKKLLELGRKSEAQEWLVYHKTIAGNSVTRNNTVRGEVTLTRKDEYSELEEALKDALNCIRYEKALKDRAKIYLHHLDMITKQRKPGNVRLPPPLFNWEIEKVLAVSERVEIPQGHIQVCIHSAQSLEAVLGTKSSKNVWVVYNIGVQKDNTITGETAALNHDEKAGTAHFDFNAFVGFNASPVKMKSLARKKAEFILKRQKGFWPFTSEENIGKIVVSLECLASQCECEGTYPLMSMDRNIYIGGSMTVSIRIRSPLSDKDKHALVIDRNVLVVGEWQHMATIPLSHAAQREASEMPPHKSDLTSDTIESQHLSTFANVPEIEKREPLNLDWYISIDVMMKEIERLKDEEKSGKLKDAASMDATLRIAVLEAKIARLQEKVEKGELVPEVYIQDLRNRIDQDKELAKYLLSTGDNSSARAVLKRGKIMQEEITLFEAQGQTA